MYISMQKLLLIDCFNTELGDFFFAAAPFIFFFQFRGREFRITKELVRIIESEKSLSFQHPRLCLPTERREESLAASISRGLTNSCVPKQTNSICRDRDRCFHSTAKYEARPHVWVPGLPSPCWHGGQGHISSFVC